MRQFKIAFGKYCVFENKKVGQSSSYRLTSAEVMLFLGPGNEEMFTFGESKVDFTSF